MQNQCPRELIFQQRVRPRINGKNNLDRNRPLVYIICMKPDDLKEWRQKNGYSQAKLARILDVDVMTVSRWERGLREIPSFLHLALAHLESREYKNQPTKLKKGGK